MYQSQPGSQSHLFLVDLDYHTLTQLTTGTASYSSPGWSPDGWRIIYQVDQSTSTEIHRMDWDGKNDQKVSRGSDADDVLPVISPDGQKIAYFSRKPGYWALFVMDVNGKNIHAITDNTVYESVASWSPDGSRIAYSPWRNTMSPPLIAQVSVDGSGYTEFTQQDLYETDPKYSPDGSRIVFRCVGENDDNPQICSIHADGSDRRVLTQAPGGNDMPVWSPDGQKIAFVSWRDSDDPNNCSNGDCNFEIYVMDADGGNQQRITDNPAEDWYPAWSPDGNRLAFVSLRDEPRRPNDCGDACNSEIYVMNLDDSAITRITQNQIPDWNPQWRPIVKERDEPLIDSTETPSAPVQIGGGQNKLLYWGEDGEIYAIGLDGQGEEGTKIGEGENPVFSPDGKQIAYVGYLDGNQSQIYLMDTDGSHLQQLTHSSERAWWPAWSHDGEKIAYSTYQDLYLINVDGTGERQIIHGESEYYGPAWSPDDQQIVFVSSPGGLRALLYIVNLDGTDLHPLVDDADWSSPPAWSPDGQWIAYGCNNGQGEVQICILRPNGTDRKIITAQGQNTAPKWSPDGQWITFNSYRDSNWEVYIMRMDGTDQRRITEDWLSNFGPVWWP